MYPPDKANTPLSVDTYAVLSFAITSKRFQTIARRGLQIDERRGSIEHRQLALHDRQD
jgi:hypothetical protein